MRRRVGFPQPEGPTRAMNSPSAISRSTPRKALVPSDAPGSEAKYGEAFIEVRNWSKQLREPLLVELQTETDDGVTAYEKWWMGISSRSVHFWTDNR